MKYVLRLKDSGTHLYLESGKHQIDVLGGWFVRLNDFKLSVTNSKTGITTEAGKAPLPIQLYKQGRRSGRIMTLNIPVRGIYNLCFAKPESLTVKRSNLPFTRFLSTPIRKEKIEILIESENRPNL